MILSRTKYGFVLNS